MILVLDVGGSFIKAGVFDIGEKSFRQIKRLPIPGFQNISGRRREIDPQDLMKSVREIFEFLRPEFESYDQPISLFISNQMHGSILLDSSGKECSPIISWQDTRCLNEVDGVNALDFARNVLSEDELFALGNEFKAGLPVTTLSSMIRAGFDQSVQYLDIGGYVACKLIGLAPQDYCINVTNAAATGFYDFATGDWHREVLVKLGLQKISLPKIVQGKHCLGKLDFGGIEIEVYSPFGDQQVALLGAGLKPGQISLNIATGSQVSVLSPSNSLGNFQLRPFFHGLFLRTVTHIPAGRALNGFIRLFCEASGRTEEEMWSFVEKKTVDCHHTEIGANVSLFKSDFGDCGSLTHLTESNLNLGQVFCSLYNNMATNYYNSALRLMGGATFDSLLFSGGLILKNSKLRQTVIQKFGEPLVTLSPNKEDVLEGLVRIAQNKIS